MAGRKNNPQPILAGIFGGIFGGISGALIGSAFDDQILPGALIVGAYWALAESITDLRRKPAGGKPLWHRTITSILLGAAFGVALGWVVGPLLVGIIVGVTAGLSALGPRKLVLGLLVGAGIGIVGWQIDALNDALIGGAVVVIFRVLLRMLYPQVEWITFSGEHVSPGQARYVVPFEAHTGYIGTDFLQTLARDSDGHFQRNPPDIGIVESLDALAGPHFDPAKVDPLIREFYEHTTRFKLSIVPDWNRWMKPIFWLFKTYVAAPIGQANIPFNIEEAQSGMVSYVDTIDYASEDATPINIKTLRGWIRAFEATGEAIYVGIYTVVRHDAVGYVSVGFPLPESNFTATLMPYNQLGSFLLLKTRNTDVDFTGHYVTFIDDDDGALDILKLPLMDEEIDVFLDGSGALKTDHRFYFGGFHFLTLHYSIERKG